MSLINVTPSEYIVPENLALVYSEDDKYYAKKSNNVVVDVTSATLKVLNVDTAKLPTLVFAEDLAKAQTKTIVDVSDMTIAMSAKASTSYVKAIADQKVGKDVFLSTVATIDEKVEDAIAAINTKDGEQDTAIKANTDAIAKEATDRASAIATAKQEAIDAAAAAAETKDAAVKSAIEAEIAAVDAKIGAGFDSDNTVAEAIADINAQLGGDGSTGSSLSSRVADLEAATVIGTTKDAPILENGQINDDYMPVLKFQGQELGKLSKEINIIGIGAVMVGDDGKITLRLGENLNSSCFNNNDGVTNGTASRSFSATGSRTLKDGTSKSIWLKGTNTVTITTSGEIHFDDATTGEFELTVNGQKFTFGPITGAGTYGTDTEKAKLVIGNDWGVEANTATGATGYSAKITVTVNVGSIISTDGYVNISLVQTKGSSAPKAYNLTNLFYLVTDTTTKASASEPTATLSGLKAKQLSGVVYLTSGTVNYSANVADVGNPATKNASNSPVKFDANNFAADATVDVGYSETTASGSGALANGEYLKANNTVSVTAENVNGKAAAVSTSVPYDLLVENTETTASTALIEYFNNEVFRLNDDGAKWDSSASLVNVAGLQVKAGSLIYPTSKNYSGLNEDLTVNLYDVDTGEYASATIAKGSQPNYTGLSGNRTYIRQFSKEGSMPGGTIVLKTSESVQTAIANGSLVVEVCKVFTGADTDKWYNIGYGAAANDIGKSNSEFGTINKLVYVFSDGNATDNVWVRITMTSAAATINEMSLA